MWNALETEADIKNLMELFGYFHDSCLREVHLACSDSVDTKLTMSGSGNNVLHLLFQRQFRSPSAIEIRFEAVKQFNYLSFDKLGLAVIYEATLLLKDNLLYWAEEGDWQPDQDDKNNCTWVCAEKIIWRDASTWMGAQLRYKTNSTIH